LTYSVHSINICNEWDLPKTVNARNGRQQVLFGFLVVDTIPYVIAGTCSTEHNVGLIFLLLISFLPTMLFTTWEPITPYEEKRSQQSWNRCGGVSLLSEDVQASNSHILFLWTTSRDNDSFLLYTVVHFYMQLGIRVAIWLYG
jgi:hypothetical protein